MKAFYILIVVVLFSIKLNAQKKLLFTPSIGIAANVVSSNGAIVLPDYYQFDTETNFGYNINASILLEYPLNEKFMLGIKPSYQFQSVSFKAWYSGPSIPEIFIYRNHQINSQLIRLPIVLKYKINDYYIVGEYGISSVLNSNYTVERHSYNMNTPKDVTITPICSGATNLTNNNSSFGHFFGIMFGREIKLWDKDFIIEIAYNQDINEWLYAPDEPNFINEISFRNHSISFNFGIRI